MHSPPSLTVPTLDPRPSAGELADALATVATAGIEALVATHLPDWRLPGTFAGHRVGADVRADLAFTLGLLDAAGVHQVAGSAVPDVLARLLTDVDGAATDTFSSYRLAETLLAWGELEGNPLLAGLDHAQRREVALAVDSTSFLPLLDGLLPRNYAAVLARCELGRQALGLDVDTALVEDLLARTRRLLSANPGGYLDDSEDGTGARYDIYTVDIYLFCEPLAERLGPCWSDGLDGAVSLVEATQTRNGAALSWGRSTGVLALCHAVELAALAVQRGLGDDPARWLARAALAVAGLEGWFGADGVVTAHQHRSPYGYRGPSRRLQMTLDCLGKLAWAAGRLRALPRDPGPAVGAADVLGDRHRLVTFDGGDTERGPAGVWVHRSAGTAVTLPLVGTARSDYLPSPQVPGLWEVPVDRPTGCFVPLVVVGDTTYVGGGLPDAVELAADGLDARWQGLVEVARPGGGERRLRGERRASVRIDGRSLVVDERLRLDQVPDAVSVVVPEAQGRPLRVEARTDHGHATTTIDTDGIKEWRSFWGPLPRVHQLDVDPAAELSWQLRITPALRVATEAGHHHYHRSLYGPLLDEGRVVEHPFREGWLADHDGGRSHLAEVDLFHLHWPEWFTGNRLGAADAFVSLLEASDVALVWTQHNLVPHFEDPAHEALYQKMAGAAAGVAHHSAWGMARARARYDYRPDCIHRVVPHGHWANLTAGGTDPAVRATRRAAAEAELGLDPSALRLGIVGAPRPDKDVVGFAEAFAASGRSDVELLVLSLGADEVVPDDPRITALPYQFVDRATYDRRLAAIDVVVLPFAPEGQMLTTGVVADVVALGLPSLVTSWPYLVEALGSAAVPMGDDPTSWTSTIDALDHQALTATGPALAELGRRYAWPAVATQLLDLLEEVGTRRH